jgi:uncharacterized membrane protein YeaQ/YmgE (transglycosylase-associated protein family)
MVNPRWRLVDNGLRRRRGKNKRGIAMLESHGWLMWIIIGGLAGAIAKLLMPGKDPGGIIVTILLGIAGALLMGFLGSLLGFDGDGAGFVLAIVGAFILLAVYRLVARRRRI